jgi:hypothetical protein
MEASYADQLMYFPPVNGVGSPSGFPFQMTTG